MHYRITFADALEAHRQALTYGGGRPGISRIESIEGALGRPYHGYHRSIERKATALLHGIATSHGFIDGNKRTAWLLSTLMIERSGFDLMFFDGDRIDDLVVDLVERSLSQEDCVRWFRSRIVRHRL